MAKKSSETKSRSAENTRRADASAEFADPSAMNLPEEAEREAAPTEHDAKAAYAERKDHWKSLGGAELPPPRVNVGYVTSRVIQIGASLGKPATLAAFKALEGVPLPGGAYDAGCVRALPVIGRALWHARMQHLSADAQTSTVALPPAVVTQATAVRNRMFKVIEYHCANSEVDDDPVTADLASIAEVQGSRYLDLATDLSRLAAYYHNDQWRPVLAHDRRHYKADDAQTADRLAASILSQLHQRSDQSALWLLEIYRGWADLQRTYDAVRRGASFVLWPLHDAAVPPLGALRPAARKSAPAAKAEPIKPE